MKQVAGCLIIFFLLVGSAAAFGKSVDEYIKEAQALQEGGKIKEAIVLLEQAVLEHPESSDLYVYLGLYTGMSAGQAQEYMEAGRLAMLSFQQLDKAVTLDTENPRAYLYRGLMGVKMPPFLGKLDGGINDLNRVLKMREGAPDKVSDEMVMTALNLLAEGYEKSGDIENARGALEKIIELAPGTEIAASAQERIGKLSVPEAPKTDPLAAKEGESEDIAALKKKIAKEPRNEALILELGKTYYGTGQFGEAREVLKKYVNLDASNSEAYKLLGISTARIAEKGYEENIAEDTDYLSGLAFESMDYMDKAVTLTPNDTELRLVRGIFGIMFPFFLGKHDQGVEDLEFVANNTASEAEKTDALYYLGVARQREALRYWIEVASKYPKSNAAQLVYHEMRPRVKRFDPSSHEKPVVAIDFVLGFQDELAPQTAIWIEDKEGTHVKTVYVSGFSGYAKDKQINLPVWSAISKFEGCEAVTSASIDVGHHIYTWDLTDLEGKKVKSGEYMVKVEVSYWPSMKYQMAETAVTIGKKESTAVVEEGDYIPYLGVSYLPR